MSDGAFVLPPEHALVLADESSPYQMLGSFQAANAAVAMRERIAERFIDGDGVGWHEHHHGMFHGTERAFATAYRNYLLTEWLPALDGVVEKLEAGALVADIGCGHGASTILMAQAFPNSRFVGDRLPRGVDRDRAAAGRAGGRRRPRDASRSPARPTCRARATTWWRSSTRSTTSATRSPRRAARAGGAGAGRHVHDRRAVRRRHGRGQPQPGRPLLLRDVDARLHARLAVAARPAGLGTQAGEAAFGEVLRAGGFARVRRAAETPLNIVLEARL